ncbi:YvrJ family protein [Pontibacillus salicampi]|uniref:YvrJ family protein n=1 Tax=Pontibacillus salicampi TaxID=1449801 RepID=A0ABV6LIJ0_9BACI
MGEQWIAVLSEFGFPVVVTFYLMHRIEGKLDMLNSSIHSLAEQLKAKS